MPIFIGDYYLKHAEWKKAAEKSSQLLINCLDLMDASLWLIAGGRDPQALVSLHNSIEIAFKAELERIHRVLIADNRKLDYNALKSLLKDAFHAHPRGQKMKIPDFNMDRTISFADAMDRVKELYPSVEQWKKKLAHIQSLRNDIVHYGSSQKAGRDYVEAIATEAFPFLEAFLLEASDIDIKTFLTSNIYHELGVAKNVCERLKREKQPIGGYALKSVRLAMLYTYVEWPKLSDLTDVETGEDEFHMASAFRKEIEREWADSYIERSCKICGSLNLFVKVSPLTHPRRSLLVSAAKCPHCGLDIGEDDRYLAEYHIGELTNGEVETFLQSIGK